MEPPALLVQLADARPGGDPAAVQVCPDFSMEVRPGGTAGPARKPRTVTIPGPAYSKMNGGKGAGMGLGWRAATGGVTPSVGRRWLLPTAAAREPRDRRRADGARRATAAVATRTRGAGRRCGPVGRPSPAVTGGGVIPRGRRGGSPAASGLPC